MVQSITNRANHDLVGFPPPGQRANVLDPLRHQYGFYRDFYAGASHRQRPDILLQRRRFLLLLRVLHYQSHFLLLSQS